MKYVGVLEFKLSAGCGMLGIVAVKCMREDPVLLHLGKGLGSLGRALNAAPGGPEFGTARRASGFRRA